MPICACVCFGVALLYARHQTKMYTATAQLQFTANTLPSQVAGVQQTQSVDPEGDKATNVALVTTLPVASLVAKSLKLNISPSQLLEQVTASNPQNDYIVNVSATNTDPHFAANVANSFAQQYVVYSQQQNESQLIKGEQLIDKRYAELPANDNVNRANLRALYQKLLLTQAVQTANAHVVNTATPPSSPSSPKTKQLAAVALVLGLLVGVGFAFLLNLFDRRVRSWEEFEELYGMSTLASIPLVPRLVPRRPRAPGELETAIEPFRILHNSLSVLRSPRRVKTVLVTSAIPGEGKTTVALGLARAAALSGQEVILVEADLRRPTLQQQLLQEGSVRIGQGSLELSGESRGLTSVLLDGANPLDLLTTSMPGVERLKLLFGGPVNLAATNLMRSGRLAKAFDLLVSQADLVVIDSAPLLPVVDTQLLLDEVAIDACLIVARVGTTTREQARRARAIFDRRQLSNTGLVINGISEIADGSYYGYGHEIAETTVAQSGPTGPQNGSGLSRPPSYPQRFAIEHSAPTGNQNGNDTASIDKWPAHGPIAPRD